MGVCSTRAKRETIENAPASIWHIEVDEPEGSKIKLLNFRGKKALIIVNVKDKNVQSVKTNKELAFLSGKYKNRGLEILVFPSTETSQSREHAYTVAQTTKQPSQDSPYKMFSPVEINGKNTHPLFKFLRTNSTLYNPAKKDCGRIGSDFTKFLVDKYGNVVKIYPPNTNSKAMEEDIETLLNLT